MYTCIYIYIYIYIYLVNLLLPGARLCNSGDELVAFRLQPLIWYVIYMYVHIFIHIYLNGNLAT